mmetsp:Transcript_5430/g.11465  ORF Transcript_5430/g.11465 Transcript_5430/m.11465 type:complete len:268 (+) Transcript_5430:148-951(+)
MFRQGGSKPPKQMLSKPCHRGPVHDGIIRTITTTRLCWTTTGVHNQRENLRQVVSGKDGDSHHFVDNKSPDSHHGGTSVVEFDRSLLDLGLFVELVPSEVNESIAEITREFTFSGNILHDEQFKESDEGNDLVYSGSGDTIGTDSGPSVSEGVERVSGVVNRSREVDSGTGDDVSEESQLTDSSVLDLNVSKTVESVLVSVGDQSERIEKTKRRLRTKGVFEGAQGSAGSLLLGRGESSGGGDKGGKDGGLHGGYYLICLTLLEYEL